MWFTVAWTFCKEVIWPFIKKYWIYIVAALIILAVLIYVAVLRGNISDLNKTVKERDDTIATQQYEMANLKNELVNREKDIAYQKDVIELLEKLKQKEIIREKYYNTRVETNNTIVGEYAKDQNIVPVLCQIDRYFGLTSELCDGK